MLCAWGKDQGHLTRHPYHAKALLWPSSLSRTLHAPAALPAARSSAPSMRGRLSLDPDHRVDTAELIRAGYALHAARQENGCSTLHRALQDAAPHFTSTRQDAAG